MSFAKNRSLAFRFAATVFMYALLIGESFALLLIAYDYWDARVGMENEITQIMQETRGASAEALRRTDRPAAMAIVRGFMTPRPVYSASLIDSFGFPLASEGRRLTKYDADWIFRRFAEGKRLFLLPIFPEGSIVPVGSVHVGVDTYFIYGNAIQRGKRIALFALLQAFLLATITYRIAQNRISRNLDHLRSGVLAASLGEISPTLFSLPNVQAGQEMNRLEKALNEFVCAEATPLPPGHQDAHSATQPPATEEESDTAIAALDRNIRKNAATEVLLNMDPQSHASKILSWMSLPGKETTGLCHAYGFMREMEPILVQMMGGRIRVEIGPIDESIHLPIPSEYLARWMLRSAFLARSDMPMGGVFAIQFTLNPPRENRQPQVRITLSDSGQGSHLQTHSDVAGSSGRLRWRITQNLAQLVKGYSEIQTAENLGTRLHLILPMQKKTEPWQPPPDTLALVVHSSPVVTQVISSRLREIGMDVLEAGSATQAMERALDAERTIDVLIIEDPLPETPADQVIERLRARAPTLRAICLSGMSADEIHLELPCSAVGLRQTLCQAMETPVSSSESRAIIFPPAPRSREE